MRLMSGSGVERRLAVRNVVVACWPELVQPCQDGATLALDAEGRAQQGGGRVVCM